MRGTKAAATTAGQAVHIKPHTGHSITGMVTPKLCCAECHSITKVCTINFKIPKAGHTWGPREAPGHWGEKCRSLINMQSGAGNPTLQAMGGGWCHYPSGGRTARSGSLLPFQTVPGSYLALYMLMHSLEFTQRYI
jgi:hypothetical protein